MEYGIIGVLVFIANIYALYHIFTSSASTGAKVLWTIGILLLPVLGFIAWLITGPRSTSATV